MPEKNRGLTLVELIVALAIFLLIFVGVSIYMLSTQRGFFWAETKTEVAYEGTNALDLMVSELQHAGYHHWDWDMPRFRSNLPFQPPTGLMRFVVAADTEVRFQADLNNSNGIDTGDANEDITYRVIGNRLERVDNVIGVTDLLGDNVDTLTFSYFDGNNTRLITPVNNLVLLNNIRRVEITYTTAQQTKGGRNPVKPGRTPDIERIILNTGVMPRNTSLER